MGDDMNGILKNKAFNGWRLFWLISVSMSIVMVVAMLGTDMSAGSGVSHMIGFSVKWAVPFVYLVIAASALPILFPGPLSTWLLRNRKYLGLCFAVAMAWQGLFIFMISGFFRDYYFEEIFYFRDELEGSTGYIFLTAMVLTSFQFGRKYLNQRQWKLLHRFGLIYLWAYPFSVYWWGVARYYGDPQPIDYVFYWTGFLAFASRIAAWGKKRHQAITLESPASGTPFLFKSLGGVIIGFGLLASAVSPYQQEAITTLLTTPAWSANLELWVPYWPFEPFLSLFIIGIGTALATKRIL
jgi:DMSO/TMAO reductase YedYZ heme-binding membrane subunit